jgi:hypothetical protein
VHQTWMISQIPTRNIFHTQTWKTGADPSTS